MSISLIRRQSKRATRTLVLNILTPHNDGTRGPQQHFSMDDINIVPHRGHIHRFRQNYSSNSTIQSTTFDSTPSSKYHVAHPNHAAGAMAHHHIAPAPSDALGTSYTKSNHPARTAHRVHLKLEFGTTDQQTLRPAHRFWPRDVLESMNRT